MQTRIEQKPLKVFYGDLARIVAEVREAFPEADNDSAFKQAAKIIADVVQLCENIEKVDSVFRLKSILSDRSKLMRQIGPGGRMGIESEASKELAIKYLELTKGIRDKVYWPASNCPKLFGGFTSMHIYYSNHFDNEIKTRAEEGIRILEARLAEYEDVNNVARIRRKAP